MCTKFVNIIYYCWYFLCSETSINVKCRCNFCGRSAWGGNKIYLGCIIWREGDKVGWQTRRRSISNPPKEKLRQAPDGKKKKKFHEWGIIIGYWKNGSVKNHWEGLGWHHSTRTRGCLCEIKQKKTTTSGWSLLVYNVITTRTDLNLIQLEEEVLTTRWYLPVSRAVIKP